MRLTRGFSCVIIVIMNTKFNNVFTAEAHTLADILHTGGVNMRLVGGAVRDTLLGLTPKDLDFAVDQPPERITEILEAAGIKVIPTGLQHGTVTAVIKGEPFELTTLRIDVDTDGRHAEVEWTSDFEQDAGRRDFTINAMSIDRRGNLFDYFDGQADLKNGLVKFIGCADRRIQEDYLRILRFFRFHQKLNSHTIDCESVLAMSRNVEGLKKISGERIWMEMSKILIGGNLTDTVELMDEVGLFEIIGLPGFRISVNERARTELTINPITVLAIGCKTRDDASAVSDTINNWWKVPAEDRDLFSFLVAKGFHMQQYNATYNIGKLKELAVQPKANVGFVTELSVFINAELFHLFFGWEVPTFPVRGQDLIESGMPPGPGIGIALSSMLEQWIKSDFKLTKEDLLN